MGVDDGGGLGTMKFIIANGSLLFALLFVSGPVYAACTDGTNCRCDRLQTPGDPIYDSTIVFCADFDDVDIANRSHGETDWPYGQAVPSCDFDEGLGPPYSIPSFGQGVDDCADIVDDTTPTFSAGGCGVTGETNCQFDGNHSLGARSVLNHTGGFFGDGNSFPITRNFGVTMMMKWSSNYLVPDNVSLGNGPAHKPDEFGLGNHALFGASVGNATVYHPFKSSIANGTGEPTTPCNTVISNTIGTAECETGTGFTRFYPDIGDYEWGVTHGLGEWICYQVQYINWGLSDATVKQWANGVQLIEAHVDMSAMWLGKDQSGMAVFSFGNYYNGPDINLDFLPDGYPGATPAYRYEDNIVISTGAAPVPCADIGFGAVAATPSLSGVTLTGASFQ